MTTVPLTLVFIDPIGLPPYAARGLKQTLEPIQQVNQNSGNLRRTVTGKMVNVVEPQFQLYHTTITGSDVDPPALGGVWPGMQVSLDCIAELGYLTAAPHQERQAVDSNYRVEGSYTYYRPRLHMTVVSFTMERDEWGHTVSWSMELEETGG